MFASTATLESSLNVESQNAPADEKRFNFKFAAAHLLFAGMCTD
jgi:hypothetical protein